MIPLTSACERRSSTVPARHASSSFSARAPPWPLIDSANCGRRSAAWGRGGGGGAVQQQVLDELEQVFRDLLVDGELAGVDDAHRQPGVDGMVEKRRVHRLAHALVAAERERDVADAAGGVRARVLAPQLAHVLDEADAVVRLYLHAGGDGENRGVEDDVALVEALVEEDLGGARTDLDLALDGAGLAALVEGHDDDGGAVAADESRLLAELRLALFQRNGVDDGLPLRALQARRGSPSSTPFR